MQKKAYLYLSDEGIIREGYDTYIVISENYIDTIEVLEAEGKAYEVCPSCWKCKSDVDRDAQYLQNVKRTMMGYLCKRLNSYHGLEYSDKEWGFILDAWLDSFLSVIWEKYCRFKEVCDEMHACDIQTVVNDHVPLDYADFISAVSKSWEFNNSIFNHIIEECCADNVTHVKNDFTFHYAKEAKKTSTYYKLIAFRSMVGIFSTLFGKRVRVILKSCYFPREFQLKMLLRSGGRILPLEFGYSKVDKNRLATRIDYEWRRKNITGMEAIDGFPMIATKLAFRYIPLAYLEDFQQIENWSKKLYRSYLSVKGAFHVCEGITSDEVYKHYLIRLKQVNKEAKYCGTQHGGNYGVAHNALINLELANNDFFYSWGWKSSVYASTVIPMPMVKTISKKITREKNRHILYVGYTFFKEIIDFSEEFVFYREHFDDEKRFFENLDDEIKNRMVVRHSQSEFGWRVKERIFGSVDGIIFDEITDFYESLKYASLVVCSSWNTTIMEALYFGLPTLVLKRIDWSLEEAKDDLHDLKRCGVLVETWEELYLTLKQLYDEAQIEKWWNEKERQDIVARIKIKYGYSGGNDEKKWENELFKYVQ